MKRRLASSVLAVLCLGVGALYAQTEALKPYLDRGRALIKAGKYEQALPYLLFALEIGESEFGTDSAAVVPLLDSLADVYATRREYRDAEPLLRRSLAIQEREASRYRSGIARTLTNLGALYEATQRPAKARSVYQRVVTDMTPELGSDHPFVQTASQRLAALMPKPAPKPLVEKPVAEKPVAEKPMPEPPTPVQPVPEKPTPEKPTPEKPTPEKPTPEKPTPTPLAEPAVTPTVEPAPEKPAVAKPAPEKPTPEQPTAVQPAPETPIVEKPEPQKPTVVAAPAAPPPYTIHLTSIRNPDLADAEWRRLQKSYPELLRGLLAVVTPIDLGKKRGVWYRIQGAPLARAEANTRCAVFRQRGIWCAVLRAPKIEAPAPAPVVAAEDKPKPSAQPALSSGFRIHLTSVRNRDDAESEWRRLRRLYTLQLEDLVLQVIRADLGGTRGVWYRIQGGPLSRSEARARCASFASLKIWCQVVPPPGSAATGSQRPYALRLHRGSARRYRGTRLQRQAWRPPLAPEPGTRCQPPPCIEEPGARRFS